LASGLQKKYANQISTILSGKSVLSAQLWRIQQKTTIWLTLGLQSITTNKNLKTWKVTNIPYV